ncbi:MAG: YkgJ family cysteine cluster protein [Methanocella sp.]
MTDECEIRPESFHCGQCGVCCRTQKVVLLTLGDVFRISERLGMRPGAFYRRYCMKSDRLNEQGLVRIYLKTEGGCPFLKDRQCSIHEFKPIVCARSPFYYTESSLAVLKVLGVLVPGCAIEQYPYGTVAHGNNEPLVDMEIEVTATDEYMRQSGKFDEKTALDCYDEIRQALADSEMRAMAYQKLHDDSIRREDTYRNDPYYRGATLMYLSGFHKEFRDEAMRLAGLHPGMLIFEPAAVGIVGGEMIVALQDKDYKEIRKRIDGRECGVSVNASVRSGIEYSAVTITTGGSPATFFYYYLDAGRKPSIRHQPGKVSVTFMNSRKEAFAFTGDDLSGWLK